MKIVSTNVFVGPNVWASFPVIRHVMDLGPLEDWPSAKIGTAFIDGLIAALPGLGDHGCSYGEAGGFIRRLREDEGTWLGHVLEHCALEVQNVAGTDVTFGRTRGTGELGHYNMVYQYRQRDAGLAAGDLALRLLMHLLPMRKNTSTEVAPFYAATWTLFALRLTNKRGNGNFASFTALRPPQPRCIALIECNAFDRPLPDSICLHDCLMCGLPADLCQICQILGFDPTNHLQSLPNLTMHRHFC